MRSGNGRLPSFVGFGNVTRSICGRIVGVRHTSLDLLNDGYRLDGSALQNRGVRGISNIVYWAYSDGNGTIVDYL